MTQSFHFVRQEQRVETLYRSHGVRNFRSTDVHCHLMVYKYEGCPLFSTFELERGESGEPVEQIDLFEYNE